MARAMVLNDGTEVQVKACGADEEQLSAVILGMHSLPEIVRLLTPEATARIEVRGVEMVDCQQTTPHMVRMGAEEIPRKIFLQKLRKLAY